jgi:signal transduction histidine kinase
MKNETVKSRSNSLGNRIRFSIVLKLNTKLVLHTISTFLSLDILLCILFFSGIIIHSEQIAASAAGVLQESGLPAEKDSRLLKIAGCEITPVSEKQKGFEIPGFLQGYYPELTRAGTRMIDFPKAEGLYFWQYLEKAAFRVSTEYNGKMYLITITNEQGLTIFLDCFAILSILELFMIMSSLSKGAKSIRSTLHPIEELAETARSLNETGTFTPEELEALAGKLDGINAAKLDTRISVGDTQNELKTLASAINGMLDRINESYRSQVRFVSDASHELRTPISVIQGYANLLDRWGKNDEKTLQESIDAIKEETANMKNLVEKLLFLARGDNNTMKLQIENFDLFDLAQEVFRETQMIDSGHEYRSNISHVFLYADQSLIKQAMRILIDNAMKYTPTGKQITISVFPENNFARLTVQDEGIGIPAEALPQIFERFYRADESRARTTGGNGLGLSIAKWITERHGGHMEVLSREDFGTKISILLPSSFQIIPDTNNIQKI